MLGTIVVEGSTSLHPLNTAFSIQIGAALTESCENKIRYEFLSSEKLHCNMEVCFHRGFCVSEKYFH